MIPVRRSLRELRAVQAKVEAKRHSARMRGCTIPVLGVRAQSSRVRIGLHPYDERVAAWPTRKFGADRVMVVPEMPIHYCSGVVAAD